MLIDLKKKTNKERKCQGLLCLLMVLGSRCDSQFNNFAPISQQEVSKNRLPSTFVVDFVVTDDADDTDTDTNTDSKR